MRHEWVVAGAVPFAADPVRCDFDIASVGLERWSGLQHGDVFDGPVTSFLPSEQAYFNALGLRSIAVVPVFAGEGWWGFLGLAHDFSEREWSRSVIDALRTAAATLGAAIFRNRVEETLREDVRQRERVEAELRAREAQLAEAQAIAHVGSWVWDIATDELRGSDELYRIYGFEPSSTLSPGMILQRVHPDDFDLVRRTIDDAVHHGTSIHIDHRIVRPPGEVRRFHVEGRVVLDEAGVPSQIIGAGQDITERYEAETTARKLIEEQSRRTAAEAEQRRATFLADASRVLGASFDYHTTLASLARLAVPTFADFCTVDILDGKGRIQRVGIAHADPEKEALLHEITKWVRTGAPMVAHLHRALVDGEATLQTDIDRATLVMHAINPEHEALILQLAPTSVACVPLKVTDKVIGALVWYTTDGTRNYRQRDLELAAELARRAALAVENARLYHESEQATRARDQMLGVVAHDLRNPLNTMLMAAELLAGVADSAPCHDRATRRRANESSRTGSSRCEAYGERSARHRAPTHRRAIARGGGRGDAALTRHVELDRARSRGRAGGAAAGVRRPSPHAAGVVESHRQRREVHAAGRAHCRAVLARRGRCAIRSARYRSRNSRRGSSARLRAVLAGVARGSAGHRARSRDREGDRRGARRKDLGGEHARRGKRVLLHTAGGPVALETR
jgi:PAS domain S-box-containing protein